MSRWTIKTEGGNRIDIVHAKSEAIHKYFVLYHSLSELLGRCKELGIQPGQMTNKMFKLLRFEKLIKKQVLND